MDIFFYRFVMVVRKNVLEYIIALVVVKNKVRLKKCLKKFQIWQSSIVQINLSITSLRLIPKFRPVFEINVNKLLNWCPRDGSRGRTWHPPPHKIAKHIIFFGMKSWFFTRKTPTIFMPPSAQRNFFKSAPSSLKS